MQTVNIYAAKALEKFPRNKMEQKLCYFVAHREQKSEGYDKFLEMGALNPKFCDGQKNRKRRTSLLETTPIKQKQNRKKNNNKRQKKKERKEKTKTK